MLITNPYYSCIRSYIKSIEETFDKHKVKCEYKSYDQSKDNYVYFICYDLKSNIELNDDIYLKEVKYEGELIFYFNQSTNEIYIKQLPYVMYGNTKVLVFTSDIAQIIVERLTRYIPKEEIKLVFSNPLILFAEDTKVAHVIPSIVDTPNHKLLASVMETIKIEEAKIMAETLRYKERLSRIERSQERAIAQKRKILGLDPKDFVSTSEFQKVLTKKLLTIWNKKLENIDRHLKINTQNYKKMVLGNGKDFVYMLEKMEEKMESSKMGDKKSRELSELLEYFLWGSSKNSTKSYQNMLNRAADFILDFDLHSPDGALAAFKRANDEDNKSDLRAIAQKNFLSNYFNSFIIYELFLREENGWEICYKYAKYNPAFKKYYLAYKNSRERNNDDYFAVSEQMKDFKMQLLPLELLIQIESLKKYYKYYKSLIDHPDRAVLKFYKSSTVWGSIMQLPYWSRIYRDSVYDTELYRHETFNLLMIQPGVTKIDFDNMVRFCCGFKSKFKIFDTYKQYIITTVYNNADRFMVTIPSSLPYSQIEMIINYAHDCGKTLNFVCENIDTSIIVKKILFDKSISSYINGEKYFKDRCFVNVDPTYYESFLTNTPNNKVLWHKYDYSSDYKYRRKQLLSFDRQIELAIDYSLNGSSSIDYQMLDALLFGDYTSDSALLPDVNDYNRRLEAETNYWENELQLSKIKQKKKAERKIQSSSDDLDLPF